MKYIEMCMNLRRREMIKMKPKNNMPMKNSKNSGKTFRRLMSYVLKEYKIHCFVVLIAILISSLAGVYGSYR